jgi:hypothetical protein
MHPGLHAQLDADTAVMDRMDVLESMGQGPLPETTLGPPEANGCPYSWRGWDPYLLIL